MIYSGITQRPLTSNLYLFCEENPMQNKMSSSLALSSTHHHSLSFIYFCIRILVIERIKRANRQLNLNGNGKIDFRWIDGLECKRSQCKIVTQKISIEEKKKRTHFITHLLSTCFPMTIPYKGIFTFDLRRIHSVLTLWQPVFKLSAYFCTMNVFTILQQEIPLKEWHFLFANKSETCI